MGKHISILLFTLLYLSAHGQTQRLSPRPDEVISLNGKWNFQEKYQINVPGEWVMQGFTVNEGETALYSRSLPIPVSWKGQRIKLRFDAVSSHAIVKVNGVKTGEHEGGFVPFEVDITDALKEDNNILEVAIQALTVSDYLACTSQYAVHTVGGMLRKVSMFALPPVNMADITINTVFDKQYRNATLQIATITANESQNNTAITYRYTLKDAEGKVVLKQHDAQPITLIPQGKNTLERSLIIKAPRQWNPEQPYLYELQVELLQNGKPIQSAKQKVGFRQVTIRGNELLVNGKPVKLRGVNRHEVHPLTGRSIAPELNRQDAILFRDVNCNYIRTSHYPPSEEFLQAADELGLFVESESAITWVEHGASPIWQLWNYKDEKFLPLMIQANAENIMAGKNHPSIIIWSLANESRWSPLWEKVNAFVKKTDPTRPTTFHDQCWGGFNNAGSKADIAVYHYPGINGPAAAAASERPVLFGEYAHISCYNRRELITDPGVRSAYNAPLVTFYDSIYHYKGCLGGAIWSGIDDIFHLPDGRIVGYGPWGPIDAWRRPKPEYAGMKKAYSPIKITAVKDAGDHLEVSIVNRYDFISLKDIKITANGLTIPTGEKLRIPKTERVHLVFTDPRGFITDEEIFSNPPVKEVVQRNWEVSWSENNGAIFVKQGPITYMISKIKGIIESVRKGNDTLITQGPVFCVAPVNSEDGGKPNVAGETYQNNIYPLKTYPLYTIFSKNIKVGKEAEGVRISMDVTYTTGKGRQSYLFTASGEFVTEYEVIYSGGDMPYQYGLLLQLPRRFERLQWERDGEFSMYDETDIARNKGETMLKAKQLNAVEEHGVVPEWPWKDDANELGSNDFRSTKRFIRQAALSDANGNRLEVMSNGKQASRTWLQDECIQWLIADYSNNGSEKFYDTPHNEGRINIKGKTIKGKVTVRMP